MAQIQVTLTQQPQRTVAGGFVPPLKWAGGKRWLVPELQKIWKGHEHRRLVEPFAGGLSVALGLLPERALLNDLNAHLINFYTHLRQGLVLDIHGGTSERTYYSHRGAFNELVRQNRATGSHEDAKRAAMLFYYLNRHCYNGLCRFNQKGEFNTPLGRYVNPKFSKDLSNYAAVLKDWEFTVADFADVPLSKGDFVYADPPYDNAYTGYSGSGFNSDDQDRLARRLAKHDGPVLISNHATPAMLGLYKELGFDVSREYRAPRMIHCFGDRTPAREVLATMNLDQ
jgi:DNA adenine methylase